ncbi:hypothetical protein PUNSTDRAFT_141793 [Punctularia strigosozonata HHB-11173 SS5]|uniref:uncharacterized protein n=1 Tax=Punctularia strigosozonata (strain HHB-11173) TaxID=741275 RepID=UPI0004417005|nr:uncharacterized protein PUNSTDRAFT_141793 [Punctularia strigosozonata HHB-11173 SS5]EIN11424.1 hypothetical protein PUNSTDRAFT_141793 [Punctularia strigosozonata HHB-11173 SS5]
MCVGENSADHAVKYLNAQLAVLHSNAVECVARHSNGLLPSHHHRYSFALAEFHFHSGRGPVKSLEDLEFYGSFDKPRLEFVCNHETVLYLKIKKGHFNVEYATNSQNTYAQLKKESHQHVDNYEVAFRVPFGIKSFTSPGGLTGNGEHLLQIMVLDYARAKMVLHPPAISSATKAALSLYLKKYLDLLRHSGHHVLYSLPDFDDDQRKLTIDYALISAVNLIHETETEVHGVSLGRINNYLAHVWGKAAMLACGRHGLPDDLLSVCLAEFKSTWIDLHTDAHFHVKFGAPKVKAICAREVLVTFVIDEILFYGSDDFDVEPRDKYEGWELAFMVEVKEEKDADGCITRYVLDLDTARFCDHLSVLVGVTGDVAAHYCDVLIEFIQVQYLDILESCKLHIICEIDVRHPEPVDQPAGPVICGLPHDFWGLPPLSPRGRPADPDVEFGPLIGGEVDVCGGYEHVSAVSQISIITLFKTIWETASRHKHTFCLRSWSYDDSFTASFGALTIRLISNEKAIVWVNIDEGTYKTLNGWLPWSGSTKHTISQWRIAFEVNIKSAEHASLKNMSSSWVDWFKDSFIFQAHGTHTDRAIHHMYLDFETAVYVHELSTFGKFITCDRQSIEHTRAVVHYIQEHYLLDLAHHGHHILHSLPVWRQQCEFGLTSFAFQIYSKLEYHRHNCIHYDVTHSDSPCILILGMYSHVPLPTVRLKWTTTRVITTRREVHGTVTLSRKSFLEGLILAAFAKINAETTLVARFAGVDAGEWKLDLDTWASHDRKKLIEARSWAVQRDGFLQYVWDHSDVWTYTHNGGPGDLSNGQFTVACHTKNDLSIPVGGKRHNGVEIMLHGETTIRLGFEGSSDSWSTSAGATWKTTITSSSTGGGLKLKITPVDHPNFHVRETKGHCRMESQALLRAQLENAVHPGHILDKIKPILEGFWKFSFPEVGAYALSHPIFTCHGDLILELRTYVEEKVVVTETHEHTIAATGVAVHGTPRVIAPKIDRPRARSRPSWIRRVASNVKQRIVGDERDGVLRPSASFASLKSNGHATNGNGNGHSGYEVKSPMEVHPIQDEIDGVSDEEEQDF